MWPPATPRARPGNSKLVKISFSVAPCSARDCSGFPPEDLMNLGGMAAQLLFLRYSRDDELEADKLSVEYSSLAGYDPRDAIGFFQTLNRMQEKEGQGMPNFLSTHPNPGDRIERIRELIAGRPPEKRGTSGYFPLLERDRRVGTRRRSPARIRRSKCLLSSVTALSFSGAAWIQSDQPTHPGRDGRESEPRIFGLFFGAAKNL